MAYELAQGPQVLQTRPLDFSAVSDLGTTISNLMQGRRINAARQSAMQDFQGGDYQSAFAKLMSVGDTKGMESLSQMQQAQALNQYRMDELGLRKEEVGLRKQELDIDAPSVGQDYTQSQPVQPTTPSPGPTSIAPPPAQRPPLGATPPPTPQPAPPPVADTYTPEMGSPTSHRLTKEEQKLDTEYRVKDWLPWQQSGLREVNLGIKSLEKVQKDLLSAPEGTISGPTIGQIVKASEKPGSGIMSNAAIIAARKSYGDAPWNAAAAHKRAVVASLRPLVGARAAAQIYQSIFESTYDPSVTQAENARRVGLLIEAIKGKAKDAQNQSDYYRHFHTLSGYGGTRFNADTLDSDIDSAMTTKGDDIPYPPGGHQDKDLQWSPSMQVYRDKKTNRYYNKNMEPVEAP
jgi:hypothetical protein